MNIKTNNKKFNKKGDVHQFLYRAGQKVICDVQILEFSVRISPWMLTKDPRPQKYCNLQSAVSPQSSLCSATHCG